MNGLCDSGGARLLRSSTRSQRPGYHAFWNLGPDRGLPLAVQALQVLAHWQVGPRDLSCAGHTKHRPITQSIDNSEEC